MTILNGSNTEIQHKDYWRTSPELISDSLKLIGSQGYCTDVCCLNESVAITSAAWQITEKENALNMDSWFLSYPNLPAFCNPPFSKKWEFFQKAKEQVSKWGRSVLMVLPYTPCTKEWHNNLHNTDCVIYVPDGRYQYLLPDGSRAKNSCNFETCLIFIVPHKLGNVIINYKRSKC